MEIVFETDFLSRGLNRITTEKEVDPKGHHKHQCISGEATFFLRDIAQEHDSSPGTWYLKVTHVTLECHEWKQVRELGPLFFVSSNEVPDRELATVCYFGGGNKETGDGTKRLARVIERPKLIKLGNSAAEVW